MKRKYTNMMNGNRSRDLFKKNMANTVKYLIKRGLKTTHMFLSQYIRSQKNVFLTSQLYNKNRHWMISMLSFSQAVLTV